MNAIEKHLYEKGRKDGLEEAAKVAEASCSECCERLAKDIRALKGKP